MPSCKLADCPVAKDGRCLEGRGNACPNLILDAVGSSADKAVLTELDANDAENLPIGEEIFEPLPGIFPLELDEARYFSKRGRAVLVVLAGMPDSGKTSLLARLHQMFQAGSVTELDFAGSRSLPRFEELNWMATYESGAQFPSMEHTSAQFDNSFLHLAVRPRNGGTRVDLLFNDIAGETFKNIIDVQTACESLLALGRADHLVVLVDGASLADPKRRFLHTNQVHEFLQRLIQGGQCGLQTCLHLVTSKMDIIDDKSALLIDELEAEVRAKFTGQLGACYCWRIAARPMNGQVPTIKPICDMVKIWIHNSLRVCTPIVLPVSGESLARDFCKFGFYINDQ